MRNHLFSKYLLENLDGYRLASHLIYHPTLGEFHVLEDLHGSKLLKKIVSEEQLSRIDATLFDQYHRLNSTFILKVKGVSQEFGEATFNKSIQYALYCEYFETTLKDEIEERALNNSRYNSQKILHILQNVSSALADMQKNKLVHGELKSSNIVKIGKDYKLIIPHLFGKISIGPKENIPEFSLKNTTKIISPEILNALHREVVDPVHEDYKDDIYALGLIALDMMTLRVENPIPIQKKLERANFFYSNTLLRLVKKMIEEVLTLRLDPIACNLYVEKIYSKRNLETFKSSLIYLRRNNLAYRTDNFQEEDNDELCVFMFDSKLKNSSISQQPSPLISRQIPNIKYTRSNQISPSIKKELDPQLPFPTFADENYENQQDSNHIYSTQKLIEPGKIAFGEVTPLAKEFQTKSNTMNESVYSRYHQGNSSATFSKAPTNATFTPRYSNQEDCIGNNSNIGDIFDLSVHKFNEGKSPEHEHNKLLINESKKFGGLPETSSILEERNEIDKRIVNNQSLERRIKKTKEKLKLLIPKGKAKNAKEIIVRLEGERKSSCSGLQDFLCGNFYCLKENNFITSKKSSARIERLNENDNYDIYLNRKNTETPLEKETLSYLNKSENSGRSEDIERKTIFGPIIGNNESIQIKNIIQESFEKSLNFNKIKDEEVETQVATMRSPYDGRQSKDFHVLEFIDQSLGNNYQNREFSRKFSLKGEKAVEGKNIKSRIESRRYSEQVEKSISGFCEVSSKNRLNSPTDSAKQELWIRESKSHLKNQKEKLGNLKVMTEKIHDGSIYHGEMLGFLRHGQGRMTYSNGKYYEGQWELGEITGYGTLFSKDNSIIYQGTWKNGKYHGQGTLFNYRQLKIEMKFKERPIIYEKQVGAWVKFKGEFKEDRWDGYGGLLFTNGDNYKGEFKNDKIHGNGFYEAKSGRVWKGIWEDNSFII